MVQTNSLEFFSVGIILQIKDSENLLFLFLSWHSYFLESMMPGCSLTVDTPEGCLGAFTKAADRFRKMWMEFSPTAPNSPRQ